MRLGAYIEPSATPEQWIANVRKKRYRAAYCPVDAKASDAQIEEYRLAALENDIVVTDVGAWGNNPMSADRETAEAGIAGTIRQLELAEKIRARCCVNVSGSLGAKWDEPDPGNLSPASFDRLAGIVRRVVDAVRPVHTRFTLEPMPYMFPTSPEEIAALLEAVDRPGFAVHMDIVNMLNSVDRYFRSGDFTRKCFALTGRHIRAVHVKDCRISGKLPVCILEIPLGQGEYDLASLIACAKEHPDPDLPLMLEHLPDLGAYDLAAACFRRAAAAQGVVL